MHIARAFCRCSGGIVKSICRACNWSGVNDISASFAMGFISSPSFSTAASTGLTGLAKKKVRNKTKNEVKPTDKNQRIQ